tara:strand:+ start:1622 stop:1837 length:216 start_codon:yes stop_codon:yes gene_type:complete
MATNHVARPRRNEDSNRFIKRFQRKCKKLGIFDDVKDKRYYKKPSERRRIAKKKAIARYKKKMKKQARNTN